MNQRDKDNLSFLLNTPDLTEWYAQTSADDIEYASELLTAYAQELTLEEFGLGLQDAPPAAGPDEIGSRAVYNGTWTNTLQ